MEKEQVCKQLLCGCFFRVPGLVKMPLFFVWFYTWGGGGVRGGGRSLWFRGMR